ncbi:hypothetical protein GCU56_22650 [Geodermatophilus sabuli]|uniref:Camelysin metallo-endopeptidase n=1 Tax=Geodermatophilus sabuli TaxID=1564158 RepID=A0A7K3W7H4_9ACTN|nr:hypothetical protein [Geodermatophilus sabuli]NEK60660.1 hypothetical protein [Geodermatophilus sabuli]
MRTSTSREPRRAAAATIGSIAVVATAAAVAGLGTFGTFTDSTTPVGTTVGSGVVEIALSAAANRATVPFVTGGWVPGDEYQVVVDLVNTGTSPLSSMELELRATTSSLLDSDAVDGLQLVLESCDDSWDVAGAGYSCAGDVTTFYAGPVVMDQPLIGAASLAPGGLDHLRARVLLPDEAGNGFQNASSTLEFVFTGVQRGGTDR